MITTTVLAQMLGIIFIVSGFSLFMNKRSVMALVGELEQGQGSIWLFGFVALIFGAGVLTLNHTWGSGLVSLISLIGWLSIIKGTLVLCFPRFAISLYRRLATPGVSNLSGVVSLLLGLVLLYKGLR